jgi:ferric-dicitrate binding protein FerR (iron transport regulator)
MSDEIPHDPAPTGLPRVDEGELASWERFFARESSPRDEEIVGARVKAEAGPAKSATDVRAAVLEALSPVAAAPTVDAHAMLARLRARRASNASLVLPRGSVPFAARGRRFATAAAWSAVAAIAIITLAQPGDGATRSIQLGPRDTGTYQAGPGQRLRVRLPDGTEVIAGPRTTVRISGPTDRRSVYVRGEAYVDADRDTVHRLIVRAGNAFLQNVGARFAVRTDSDNKEVRIAVATGVVLAADTGAPWQSGHVLTRGTVGVISALGNARTFRPADLNDAMIWEDGGPRLGRDQLRDELPRLDGA